MRVTEAEMEAAGLSAAERDYCAHDLIDLYKREFLYIAACKQEKHVWESCQYEE